MVPMTEQQDITADPASAESAGTAADPGRLRRDPGHKQLGGVCAGLGRHCDMDPVIFRIMLAVLSVTGGIGLVFYGFVWLFVPFAGEEENEARRLLSGKVDGPALTAVLCALVGCGLFLSMLNNGDILTFGATVTLLLAGAGYWSRQRGAPDPDPLAAQAAADAPPEAQAPPVPTSISSWWRDPIVKDGTHVGGTGYLWGPDTGARETAASANATRARPRSTGEAGQRGPHPRGARWIGGWTFLLALLAGGLGTGLTWAEDPLGTSLQTGLACALGVLGVGIALSAVLGRTGGGSILLAVVTAGLLAGASVIPKNVGTQWMHVHWSPPAAGRVHPTYELGTGTGTLDLRHVDVPPGATLSSHARLGVGRLRIVVPDDVTVRLHVEVGVGDIQLPGDDNGDVDVAPGNEKDVTLFPVGGSDTAAADRAGAAGAQHGGSMDLRLEVGLGQVEVDRVAP